MNEIETYRARDLDDIHTLLSAQDAALVMARAKAVAHFVRAKDKDKAVEEIREMLPQLKGMSAPNLYKLSAKFDPEHPLISLMDGRLVRKTLAGGLALNEPFKTYWQRLVVENQRSTASAYENLMAQLGAGVKIPGYGDWRDIWAKEHDGFYPDENARCPYGAGLQQPRGWTLRNLRRIQPDPFMLMSARQGVMRATIELLPMVERTRAGLKCCRVVQIDDMWYEHKVAFGANKHAQRVVEWAMIDVATGKLFAYLPKPVIEAEEGKLKTLKTIWTRYLIAHLVHDVGIPEEGVLIMGEHGTASVDDKYAEYIKDVTGGKVLFGAGGILTGSFYEGGPKGQGKGNPRYKGLLEGFHALIKNRLAAVPGHIGGGRGEHAEHVYGIEKKDETLRKIVSALEPTRPGIRERITFPFMDYYDFRAIIDAAYETLNKRRVHALEGWQEQGFVVDYYYDLSSNSWQSVKSIELDPPIVRNAKAQAIASGEIKTRKVRLSPEEAWNLRAGDHPVKLSDSVVALEVMGLELSVTCVCDDHLQLKYKNLETFTECTINGAGLTRGTSYLVWINPFNPNVAYIASLQGKFIGLSTVIVKNRYDDVDAIKRAIGIRNAAMAAELRKSRTVRTQLAAKQAAIDARNAAEIFGEDPALKAAVETAAQSEIDKAPRVEVDLDDFDLDDTTQNQMISGEELSDL